jgi:hypothetical protein
VAAFPDTPLANFWTSSPGLHAAVVGKYFAVSFGGVLTDSFPASTSLRVRCVHSARNPNAPPQRHVVVDEQRKTMSDAYTRLNWLFTQAQTPVATVERASEICEGLPGAYRLPSYKELLTLADITRTDRAIAPALWVYQNPAMLVWSSSRTPFGQLTYAPLNGAGLDATTFPDEISTVCVR